MTNIRVNGFLEYSSCMSNNFFGVKKILKCVNQEKSPRLKKKDIQESHWCLIAYSNGEDDEHEVSNENPSYNELMDSYNGIQHEQDDI